MILLDEIVMKYYIVCDYREKFANYLDTQQIYNDHYKKSNIDNIMLTLKSLGYDCEYFGGVEELIAAINLKKCYSNCVFLNFNDGLTQIHKRGQTPILLEMLTPFYSGADAFSSLLVSDKYCTKLVIKNCLPEIKVPDSILIFANDNWTPYNFNIKYPVIVKPNNEGSSIGINSNSICYNETELLHQIDTIKNFNNILIEEYIEGFEFTVFIVGNNEAIINQPLAMSLRNKFYFEKEVFDAEVKFRHERQYASPKILLSLDNINRLKSISKKIFDTLRLRDYARLDFRYSNNEFYFIEANTVPAIGPASDVGEVCKLLNISFANFMKILIETVNARLAL